MSRVVQGRPTQAGRPSPYYVIKKIVNGCRSSIGLCLRNTRALQSPSPVRHCIQESRAAKDGVYKRKLLSFFS